MFTKSWIAHCFEQLKQGDSFAAQVLWEHYFCRLVQLAREDFQETPRRMADEEDVALTVLYRFFCAAEEGRFPNLANCNDIWRLLRQMTAQKVVDMKRRETRQRRGGTGGPAGIDARQSASGHWPSSPGGRCG